MTILSDENALAAIATAPAPAGAKRETLLSEKPDAVFAMTDASGEFAARASVWWREAPPVPGETHGVVGHFYARDEASACAVLETAVDRLREEGCTLAHGPMDGNTWRRYRFVTASDGSSPFFLEPSNPAAWPDWWERAGWTPAAAYSSSRMVLPSPADPRVAAVAERAERAGIRIRTIDMGRLRDELRAAYAVTVKAFSGAHLYTPLSEDEFLARYLSLGSALRAEFVLIAERAGETVGYLFAIPDLAEVSRTGATRTLVAKTIAVLPGREFAGLGALMSAKMYDIAAAAGFRDLIHALQYDGNSSAKNLSGEGLSLVRRYGLWSLRLGPESRA